MKNRLLYHFAFLILILMWMLVPVASLGQGYLHTEGDRIVNGDGENIILRGIGTGNWMIQEGYMMQSSGVAATHHEYRAKLIAEIGLEQTDQFYATWLHNHFRKVDVDSMAAWGFNSVRVALHYKWFTLPIEVEPVAGEQTWLNTGFDLTDSLLAWCAANEMYLILDLHGAPGGQGKNADISDYDDSKPALWESEFNKEKTIALWQKLAERYQASPWIGGYDLINEVNWTFDEGNNSPLRELYGRITEAIRTVDQNHILFIEGNGFANDFSGLTPPWDDNMVYSFHKYGTYNDAASLDWVLALRDTYGVPLWLGESGENSNTWFTNLIALAEGNNIGWSWWPIKKASTNNILRVETNADYTALMEAWKSGGALSADATYQAVMGYAEQHRFENCVIQHDVIDALIRQPQTSQTRAFSAHSTGEPIAAVDYDLGRNGHAYYDLDTADYHFNTDEFWAWNRGWQYRNDGVDIENSDDEESSHPYTVGWIEAGEWLQYTLQNSQAGAYALHMRTAAADAVDFHVEVNGKIASKKLSLPDTGSLNNWSTSSYSTVLLPDGDAVIRLVFLGDAVNFNYFRLDYEDPAEAIPFELLQARTDQINNQIYLNLNKALGNPDELNVSDFQLIVNNALATVSTVSVSESNAHQVILNTQKDLFSTDVIRVSYRGSNLMSGTQLLTAFTAVSVENLVHPHFSIPATIEAEDYFFNNGFQHETCQDQGGGENMAYADEGDYLDYLVEVPESGKYQINFRVAAQFGKPEILVMHSVENKMVPIKAIQFNATGGWQSWSTQSAEVNFEQGKMVFRVYSRKGEFNLNWFSFSGLTGTTVLLKRAQTKLSPNPARDEVHLDFSSNGTKKIELYSIRGQKLQSVSTTDQSLTLDVSQYPAGNYFLNLGGSHLNESLQFIIAR